MDITIVRLTVKIYHYYFHAILDATVLSNCSLANIILYWWWQECFLVDRLKRHSNNQSIIFWNDLTLIKRWSKLFFWVARAGVTWLRRKQLRQYVAMVLRTSRTMGKCNSRDYFSCPELGHHLPIFWISLSIANRILQSNFWKL